MPEVNSIGLVSRFIWLSALQKQQFNYRKYKKKEVLAVSCTHLWQWELMSFWVIIFVFFSIFHYITCIYQSFNNVQMVNSQSLFKKFSILTTGILVFFLINWMPIKKNKTIWNKNFTCTFKTLGSLIVIHDCMEYAY